jgi:hypothetical protein
MVVVKAGTWVTVAEVTPIHPCALMAVRLYTPEALMGKLAAVLPVLQRYVLPPDASSVPPWPVHNVRFPEIPGVARGLIVTVAVPKAWQPPALLAVTLYTVVLLASRVVDCP